MSARPSWLELERWALGELDGEDAARVERALSEDEAVAAAHRQIIAPRPALKPLGPLPERRSLLRRRPWWVPALAATAAAAGLVVAIQGTDEPDDPRERTKGAPRRPVVTLVAERDGRLREAPTRVSTADRLRLLATFDGPEPLAYDVVVVEETLTSFPMPRGSVLPRGNRVPLEGAFRLDATGRVRVCLIAAPELPSRRTLAHDPPDGRGCIEIVVE